MLAERLLPWAVSNLSRLYDILAYKLNFIRINIEMYFAIMCIGCSDCNVVNLLESFESFDQ